MASDIFKFTKKQEENKENIDNEYEEYSDFSDVEIYESEEDLKKSNQSQIDKLISFFKNINGRQIAILIFISVVILAIIIVSFSLYIRNKKAYNAKIEIPEVVYIGETYNVNVLASAKKNVEMTTTTFMSDNELLATFLNGSQIGSNVYDVLIPSNEGTAKVSVISKVNNKTLNKETKEVTICPAFDKSLLSIDEISLYMGDEYDLNINFGNEKCGEGVTYESTNNSIITIDNGKVKGMATGNASIIVKKDNMQFSIPFTITQNYEQLESFTVDKEIIQLKKDQKARIHLSLLPKTATIREFTFTNDNEEVIEIDDNGIITAKKEGDATITVEGGYNVESKKIKVEVYKEINEEGIEAESLDIDKQEVTLNVGKTVKMTTIIAPQDTRDKTITWTSSDEKIAVVTKNGLIYGKGSGTTVVTAKTSNNIVKLITVKVNHQDVPTITASDNIASDMWHNKYYDIVASGSVNGSDYYYGFESDKVEHRGRTVNVVKDGTVTYYFKACLKDDCSNTVSYTSKLDTTKPTVLNIMGIDDSPKKEDTVYIYLEDTGSLVSSYCVVSKNDQTLCKWIDINPMVNPIITYITNRNGTYYVFARDKVGNVSNSKSFTINNIS